MNPYLMPLEERKAEELRSFAKMLVVCVTIGLFVAFLIYQAKWGF